MKFSDPVRVPVAVGVKVTLTMQLLPAESDEPQLFVCEKSLLFVPPMPIVRVSGILPEFVSVTTCGVLENPTVWLPKFRLLGEIEAIAP